MPVRGFKDFVKERYNQGWPKGKIFSLNNFFTINIYILDVCVIKSRHTQ